MDAETVLLLGAAAWAGASLTAIAAARALLSARRTLKESVEQNVRMAQIVKDAHACMRRAERPSRRM